jgi:hypothetical protein
VIENVPLYGEQHRFIPALAHWKGFRVSEVAVNHRSRRFGRSKFGARRFLSVSSTSHDRLSYSLPSKTAAFVWLAWGPAAYGGAGYKRLSRCLWFTGQPIGTRPLLQLGVLSMVMGIQFLSLGLLAEQTARLQIESQGSPMFTKCLSRRWGLDRDLTFKS